MERERWAEDAENVLRRGMSGLVSPLCSRNARPVGKTRRLGAAREGGEIGKQGLVGRAQLGTHPGRIREIKTSFL